MSNSTDPTPGSSAGGPSNEPELRPVDYFKHTLEEKVNHALRDLRSPRPSVRHAAERRLVGLGPEATDYLADVIRREAAAETKGRPRAISVILAAAVSIVVAGACFHLSVVNFANSWLLLLMWAFATTDSKRSAAKALARFDDPRLVGILGEALFYRVTGLQPDKATSDLAEKSLIRLIPKVTADSAATITSAQRACFAKALCRNSRPLALAILKAHTYLLDEKAIPNVQRLAGGDDPRGPVHPDVREAAQETLLALLAVQEARRSTATLLRPAGAETAQAGELVRPSSGESQVQPAELLRPTEG